MNRKKLLLRLSQGKLHNVAFSDLTNLIDGFGFRLVRTRGSHHVYSHPDIPGLINLQEIGGKAKPYQMKQFLRLVEEYNLSLEDDDP